MGYFPEVVDELEEGDMVTSHTSLTILSAICHANSSCTTSMLLDTSLFIAFGSLDPTNAAAVDFMSETALPPPPPPPRPPPTPPDPSGGA